jgi:hypothetical protein
MRLKCPGEAEYSVKALVPAKDHKLFECSPVEVYCGLRLCAECASLVKPKDIFTQDMKECVSAMMATQHNALPDFNNSQIMVISSNDLQLLMLESHYETIH